MKPSIPRPLLVLGAIAVVVAASFWAKNSGRSDEGTVASGTVEATESQLGFPATGRLLDVVVHEGDRVDSAQVVARLDSAEATARLEEARARLDAAQAALNELERGSRPEEVAQGRATLAGARERHEDAKRDLERARKLFEGGAVSREAVDKAEMAERVTQSAADQAQEALRMWEIGPRAERVAQQRALVAQSSAQVRGLEATLANLSIVVPRGGIVTTRHREPGEIVPAGSPVITLMDPSDRWVRIYIREDRVGQVHIGAPAEITADGFPDRTFRGEVSFIASEAEFTPKNVQTPEERVKLVYAVKVRIVDDSALELKPGLPADVRLLVP